MLIRLFLFCAIFLTACAAWPVGPTPQPAVPPTPDPQRPPAPAAPVPEAGTNPRAAVERSPVYGLTMGFDAIPPIYEPQFIPAAQSRLAGDELVLGAAWGGEAKAYPLAVLTIHEMVNDEMAGVPTLVTW